MIAARCNKCNSFLQSCNCNGFKPLEILSAGKKPKTEEEIKQLIQKLEIHTFNGIDTEYIKLKEVLNIFSAKKDKKQ